MAAPQVRRADFLMALVYATDLATGQSRDFALRSCVLGMRFSDVAGLDQDMRRRTHARKFIPSATGPRPVMDDPAHPHMARGVTADGRDFDATAWMGDWRNPNMMPWVANAEKEAGHLLAGGRSQHHEFF
jgi:hypothetical protein